MAPRVSPKRGQTAETIHTSRANTTEHRRLTEPFSSPIQPWQKWGPYVSERSWGTVREDYSADGEAWNYLTHDMARSKAYRWGEDAIAGICDRYQLLVFGFAFWNGRDPILKERMFGLTNHEGNHGEDVKEYWFYLDNTPTHSYTRMLYKYPQREFPYEQLIRENSRNRGSEYELLDTGIFDEDRYFDIFVEYAKASPNDLCIRLEAMNRGPEPAELHCIPQLWFRNNWAPADPRPAISLLDSARVFLCVPMTRDSFRWRIFSFPMRSGKPSSTALLPARPCLPRTNPPTAVRWVLEEVQKTASTGSSFTANPASIQTASGPRLAFTIAKRFLPAAHSVLRLRLTEDRHPTPTAQRGRPNRDATARRSRRLFRLDCAPIGNR